MPYNTLPASATLHLTPFTAHIPQQQLDDFTQLIRLSRLGPRTYENTTTGTEEGYFGVSYEWMSRAKEVWEEDYDWRQTEAQINSFPSFIADVEDDDGTIRPIHFVALFAEKKDAPAIALLHGWPGSILEFLPVLSLIKSTYDSPSELPYHIVVPSLPGYAYSADATPLDRNWTNEDSARVLDKLMVGLGFGIDGPSKGYYSQGGDIGSFLSRILAVTSEHCKGVHLNFCIMEKPTGVTDSDVNDGEKRALQRLVEFGTTGNAYVKEHGTRSSTIGFVLSSSPIALLAWIGEKFQTWTHHEPPLTSILDSVTLYYLTSTFPRSIYPYRQLGQRIHDHPALKIPTSKSFGYSLFPYDLGPVPRAWAATTGSLSWFRQHEEGGHFAAMEVPEVFWGDVVDFVTEAEAETDRKIGGSTARAAATKL